MQKNQKILLIIIAILVVVALVVGYLAIKDNKNNNKESYNKFKEEYESLNGVVNDTGYTYPTVEIDVENPIVYSNEEELLDILKNKDGILFFGFPTDPLTRNTIKPLVSAAVSNDIEKIYYLNPVEIRDLLSVSDNGEIVVEKSPSKNYKKLLKELKDALDDYYVEDALGNKINTNEKRINVPLVVVIKAGKVVSFHKDTVESHMNKTNPYEELTKEENEELYDIYNEMFLKISESSCNKNTKC